MAIIKVILKKIGLLRSKEISSNPSLSQKRKKAAFVGKI